MINIEYENWKSACESILNINPKVQMNYLQWYPFINLALLKLVVDN